MTVFWALLVPASLARASESTTTLPSIGPDPGQDRAEVRVVGDVDERRAARDDPAAGAEVVQVAERLERLDAQDEVGLALGDEVAVDPVRREAEVGLDGAAALGHAVDLGLLDVEALA